MSLKAHLKKRVSKFWSWTTKTVDKPFKANCVPVFPGGSATSAWCDAPEPFFKKAAKACRFGAD